MQQGSGGSKLDDVQTDHVIHQCIEPIGLDCKDDYNPFVMSPGNLSGKTMEGGSSGIFETGPNLIPRRKSPDLWNRTEFSCCKQPYNSM